MVLAWSLFCPLLPRAAERAPRNVTPSAMNLYLFQASKFVEDNVEKTVYRQSEVIPLTSYDDGGTFRTHQSVELPEGQHFVVAKETPRLYVVDESGNIDPESVVPTVVTAADASFAQIVPGKLYQAAGRFDETGIYVYSPAEQILYIKKPVYLAYTSEKGTGTALPLEIESTQEMFTTDDITYTINCMEIPKSLYFGLTTTPEKDLKYDPSVINSDLTKENDFIDGHYYRDTKISFKGNIEAKWNGKKYTTTFTAADFPSKIYFAALDKDNKVTDYYEFNPCEGNDGSDYARFNYELGPLSLIGSNTDANVKYIVTRYKPAEGKKPFSTAGVSHIVKNIGIAETDAYTFVYKNSLCEYFKLESNYFGKIWLVADDENPNTFNLNFETVELRPPFDESLYYDENQPLLDKTVYVTTPEADRRLLQNDSKPLFHDNADIDDTSILINGAERSLVKMDGRRALAGPGMHINRLSAGSLASVINVNTGFENIVDEDLDNSADIVGIANVQLAAAPLLSVKDTKRYYARGTQCGFNIIGSTSGSNGTSVLSLSVVEALSIAFYRDGELMCVKPVDTAEGQGVGLNLITISSGDGSYNLTTTAPCVFDEIAIWTASGLKLNVGGDLKINYAWVGKEKEITLGTNGIAKYNEKHPGANLRVAEVSTTWDAEGLMGYDFTKDESKTENLLNTLNLLTGGVGWAKVCMDEDGRDDEQVFKKGSRINFVLEGGTILDLGIGTGNMITFYKRVVTGEGDSRKVTYESIGDYPLSATVLELDVVKIQGKDVISMVAPDDFSGSKLTVSGGLVNVGVKNIYYASVTPPPFVDHKCDLRMPTTIFLTKEETRYIMRTKGDDGTVNEQLVKTTVSYPSSYIPKWNRNVAPELEWSIAKDENGNDIVPAYSTATVNPSTGEIMGIDVVNAPGVYKLHYQNPQPGHEQCYGDINIVVKEKITYADDAELASIMGRGLLATDEDFEISSDTHDVAMGGGGIHIGVTGKPNGAEILDGSLLTAAVFPKTVSLTQNELLCGIKLKKDREKLGGKGKKMRIGFIVEAPLSVLGLDALNFLNIRCYNNDYRDSEGKCPALFGNSPAVSNTGVGLKLIGEEKVVKQRISVEVDAENTQFDEYQLWTSGVADINLAEVKVYGSFYEYLDNVNGEANDNNASQQFSSWLPDGAEVICETAKVFPIKVGTVSVGTELAKLCRLVDSDNMIDTKISWGTGAEVGTGTSLLVDMGRTITTTQKVGIYTQNIPYALEANVGKWMTINTYRSEGMEEGYVGRFEGAAGSQTAQPVPQGAQGRKLIPVETFRVPVKRMSGEEQIKDKGKAIDSVTDWKVVGAEVAGISDRSGSFFKPSQDFDLMEIQIGEVVGALGVKDLYAITTCAATDDVVRYVYLDEDEVSVSVEPSQLLRLTEKGYAALKDAGVATTDTYITYPAEGRPVYTAAQVSENEAISTLIGATGDDEIRAKVLRVVRNPENVVWTSNYLLTGDDESALATLKAKEPAETGVELYMGNETKKVKVNQQSLDDGRRVVGFFYSDGSLDSQNFSADALYWYNENGEVHGLTASSEVKPVDPVMPAAYGLRYAFSTVRHEVPFVEDVYFDTESSVIGSDGKLLKNQIDELLGNNSERDDETAVDYKKVTPMPKRIKVDNLTHHHLNCDFTYYRPNVDEAILRNYDIYMMASFRNNVKDEVSDPNSSYYIEPILKWVKDDGVQRNDNAYDIKAVRVNPLQDVSPQVSVRNTFFVPVGTNLSTEEEVDKAFAEAPAGCRGDFLPYREVTDENGTTPECEYKEETRKLSDDVVVTENVMRVEAENIPDRRPTYIDEMKFKLYHDVNNDNHTYSWYYTGNMSYVENGDFIDNSETDRNDESENAALLLNPAYYDVEAYLPMEDGYQYVTTEEVINENGEKEVKTVRRNYYDHGTVFRTTSYVDDENPFGEVSEEESNSANAAVIAVFDTKKLPTFVLTPIYIYYRAPEAAAEDGVESDDVNGLIPIEKASVAAAKKNVVAKASGLSGSGEAQIDPEEMPGDFIVKRGGAGIYPVTEFPDEILTELKELQAGGRAVITGVGYLDILGTNQAEVYNVDGVLVGTGGGRHLLEAGIYIVTAGGRTTKHLVR